MQSTFSGSEGDDSRTWWTLGIYCLVKNVVWIGYHMRVCIGKDFHVPLINMVFNIVEDVVYWSDGVIMNICHIFYRIVRMNWWYFPYVERRYAKIWHMFSVNYTVSRFLMEIIYCSSMAVTYSWISACSNPHILWKTWQFSLYTCLSSYKATRVALLGIVRIPGFTGRTYRTGDSVAYFVLLIKSLRCLWVESPRL